MLMVYMSATCLLASCSIVHRRWARMDVPHVLLHSHKSPRILFKVTLAEARDKSGPGHKVVAILHLHPVN